MHDPNGEPKKDLLSPMSTANTVSCPAFPVPHRRRAPAAAIGHLPVARDPQNGFVPSPSSGGQRRGRWSRWGIGRQDGVEERANELLHGRRAGE
jgi:hypothetical protein